MNQTIPSLRASRLGVDSLVFMMKGNFEPAAKELQRLKKGEERFIVGTFKGDSLLKKYQEQISNALCERGDMYEFRTDAPSNPLAPWTLYVRRIV